MKVYHFVYKTTNKINEKYYIGVHSAHTLDDSYLGSGLLLNKAIKKYGKDNFTREILSVFDTKAQAYSFEKDIVCQEFLNKENTYNLALGGRGGTLSLEVWNKGLQLSESHKNKLRKAKLGKKLPPRTDEVKQKISKSQLGKPRYHKTTKGRKMTEEQYLNHCRIFNSKPIQVFTCVKIRNKKKGQSALYQADQLIGIWETQSKCSLDLKVSQGNIGACLRGYKAQSNGYIFKYKD